MEEINAIKADVRQGGGFQGMAKILSEDSSAPEHLQFVWPGLSGMIYWVLES